MIRASTRHHQRTLLLRVGQQLRARARIRDPAALEHQRRCVTKRASLADCSTRITLKASSSIGRRLVRRMDCAIRGASPSSGSPGSSNDGSPMSARPIKRICCSPSEICLPKWLRRSARRGNMSYTRAIGQRPGRAATARFSSTASEGKMSRVCGTKPMPRRERSWTGRDSRCPRRGTCCARCCRPGGGYCRRRCFPAAPAHRARAG